jgi:putative nucleotidyltransferase with HDIG domain
MNILSNLPTRAEAGALLADAASRNLGPWVQHSLYVAQAARLLAEQIPGLDPDTAERLGLCHDIGRRAGVTDMRHVLDGYTYLTQLGFDGAARICLTHSFPVKNIHAGAGQWDCSAEELHFLEGLLEKVEYNGYDRLIQLCDALALPTGYCLIEKRLVDVALRHGTNPYTIDKWKAFFAIQKEFEAVIGQSIYTFLPGVIDNTFGLVSSASSASSGAPNGPSTSAAARKSSSL